MRTRLPWSSIPFAVSFCLALAPRAVAQGFQLNGPMPVSTAGDVREFVFTDQGQRVLYSAQQAQPEELFRVPSDRSSSPARIDAGAVRLTVTPDGSHVVYGTTLPDGVHLRAAPTDGSGPPITLHGPMATTVTISSIQISPDGQRAVYVAGTLLLSVRIDGSASPVFLADDFGSWEITADSERVVFREELPAARHVLQSVPIDASNFPLRLDTGTGLDNVRNFVVSSDGSTVLFAADRPTEPQLFVVPADGSAPPLLLTDPGVGANVGEFQLSPDGAWALYKVGTELRSIRTDGSGLPHVLSGPLAAFSVLTHYLVTPDSQRAVYVASQVGQPAEAVYVVPIDGSAAAVRLSGGDASTFGLRVHPKSDRVLYVAVRGGQRRIFSVPLDDSASPTDLTGGSVAGGEVQFPVEISPDAQWVVYRADHDTDEQLELYAVPLDGHAPRVKLNDPFVEGGDVFAFSGIAPFAISPDGQRVAYLADQRTDEVRELFVVPLPRTGHPRLMNDPLYQISLGDVLDFAIAPAGGRVVYRSNEESSGTVELFTVGGGAGRVKLSGTMVAGGNVAEGYSLAGGRCVYQADAEVNNRTDLYGVPIAGGSAPVRLNPVMPPQIVMRHVLAPDGSRVVFEQGDQLYSAPSDGSSPAVSLSGPLVSGGSIFDVLIAPDGDRVVYRANQDAPGVFTYYSVPIAGGVPPVPISDGQTVGILNLSGSRITPDSLRLVYLFQVGAFVSLHSTLLDGSSTPMELNGPLVSGGDVLDFAVSPSSARVVYRADEQTDTVNDLYSVPVDGLSARVKLDLALPAGGDVAEFAISSDGQWAVYLADQTADDVFELFSAPIDGSGAPVRVHPPLPADRDVASFALTPDASRVVYTADLDANDVVELYVAAVNGSGGQSKLSSTAVAGGDVASFRISPDGDWVVYTGDLRQDDRFELFSVALDGSRPQKRESGPLVPGGDVLEFQVARQPIAVYLADQDVSDSVELFFSYLLPQDWLGRADEPSESRSLGR